MVRERRKSADGKATKKIPRGINEISVGHWKSALPFFSSFSILDSLALDGPLDPLAVMEGFEV
jgi:hypothetical protein